MKILLLLDITIALSDKLWKRTSKGSEMRNSISDKQEKDYDRID